jgi:hypothetical protein
MRVIVREGGRPPAQHRLTSNFTLRCFALWAGVANAGTDTRNGLPRAAGYDRELLISERERAV